MRKTLNLLVLLLSICYFSCSGEKGAKKSNLKSDPKDKIHAEDVSTLSKEELEREEDFWEQSISEDPNVVRYKTNLATIKTALNKLDEAKKIYSDILSTDKNNCMAYQGRAYIYLRTDSFPQVINNLTNVVKICPQVKEAYKWRGYAFLHNHQYKEAIEDLSEYVNLTQTDKDAYYMRAEAYFFSDNIKSACEDIKRSGYTSDKIDQIPLKKCLE